MLPRDTVHDGSFSEMVFCHVSYAFVDPPIVKLTQTIDYRHQEDEGVASRGSIAMRTAVLKSTPGSGGLRFEVHSTPTRGNSGAQKWYIKANHPVEASRWIQVLTKSIEWSRREAEKERQSMESDLLSLKPPSHWEWEARLRICLSSTCDLSQAPELPITELI